MFSMQNNTLDQTRARAFFATVAPRLTESRDTMRRSQNVRIRTFPSNVADDHVNSTWELLYKAILGILHKNNSGLSFEELYRNAYTMVLHKFGDRLYDGLRKTITEHLKNDVLPKVEAAMNNNFIVELIRHWADHTTAMVMIRDILMYLDRVYIQQQRRDLDTVYNLGLRLFREEIVNTPTIREHLTNTMLDMIAKERSKVSIDWQSLKAACHMLIELGVNSRSFYETIFETHFLQKSAEHYRAAGQAFLAENSASVFVNKVNECLNDEKERANRYLDDVTGKNVNAVLQRELIVPHMQTVVDMENSGLVFMLSNDRVDDLRLLYDLLKRVQGGSTVMTVAMSKHLRSRGAALVHAPLPGEEPHPPAAEPLVPTPSSSTAPAASSSSAITTPGGAPERGGINPITYTQNLINLKDQFDRYIKKAFHEDKEFKNKIQSDFEFFVNLNPKSAEFLSLYIDDILKKGVKLMNEDDADTVLDKAMILFRYLQDKDVFEKYYKQHLTKRLLFAKSSSDDAEKSMISKLKTECGAHFTSKLEGMFKDMETSASFMDTYNSDNNDAGSIDLTVKVLTKGFWPTSEVKICHLPLAAEEAFNNFKNFYLSKHNGRVLTINPSLGMCDLKAVFYKPLPADQQTPDRTHREEVKTLTVSTYHMVALMRFNTAEEFTFAQLLADTQIPEKDLKRVLMSVSMGKPNQRVLTRRGTGREIENTDVFLVNDGFTSKLNRIRVQMVTNKNSNDNEPERKEIRIKVDEDRKHEVEAAIVRVMKARNKLMHNELISVVTQQLLSRFRPDPIFIKRRVESLIEREYLKRDERDQRMYHYVA